MRALSISAIEKVSRASVVNESLSWTKDAMCNSVKSSKSMIPRMPLMIDVAICVSLLKAGFLEQFECIETTTTAI